MGEVFNITHEGGNLDEYDSTVTDGGDLSVTGAAALAGSDYGLQCVIDDTTAIYGEKDFTQITSSSYRYRCYVDPNGLTMGTDESFRVCRILKDSNGRSFVELKYDGSDYQIRAVVVDDALGAEGTSWYAITDAPHYVEVLVEYASGEEAGDGELTLWIDGAQKENKTGLDVYDVLKPNKARLGAESNLDAGTSGTLYLDEFVFRDDDTEIGAASYGAATVALPVLGHPEGVHSLVFGGLVVR